MKRRREYGYASCVLVCVLTHPLLRVSNVHAPLDVDNEQIVFVGDVSRYWNGLVVTMITAEAPNQEEVEPSVTRVNTTFYYCTEV